MEAFQELIHTHRIDLEYLTSHSFTLHEATKAYDLVLQRSEAFLGLLIEYENATSVQKKVDIRPELAMGALNELGIGVIGAGSYAMSHLLPNIPHRRENRRVGVMTSSGLSARSVAERFEFEFCTSDENDILQNDRINTVIIATRHDSHAAYALKALRSGKHVFVEKPLCINVPDLRAIEELMASKPQRRLLMVGFNRRFSPLTRFIRREIDVGTMSMLYRINAGTTQPESWIKDREVSGGRIIGEACHFIDLLTFLNGSLPDSVQVFGLGDAEEADTVTINLRFANGSVGTIAYFANGPSNLPKEYLEIHKGGRTAILRDFREVEVYDGKTRQRQKLAFQDKGQSGMVEAFLAAIKQGKPSPIPFEEISRVTLVTLMAVESLQFGSIRHVCDACVG
jgi:polar amino acid transport system substrate-binding protein